MNLSKRDTDRSNGCPNDRYDSVTPVLIDLKDPISPTPVAALRNALLKIRNEIPQFGRLEIYPLQPTSTSTIAPLFARCNPGSGQDVSNRILGNPELADRLWKREFADKLDAVLTDIQNLHPQSNSPILEALQSVAVTAFGLPLAEGATDKRLIIISDMIHHTSDLSMYGGPPMFDRFKETPYYLRVKPYLRHAKLDVYLIVRETARNAQQPALYKFWVEYAAASQGFIQKWEPLQ